MNDHDVVSETLSVEEMREYYEKQCEHYEEKCEHYEKMIKELQARIDCLESDLRNCRENRDYLIDSQFKDGMIRGLKFAIRCNGVSGGEVEK